MIPRLSIPLYDLNNVDPSTFPSDRERDTAFYNLDTLCTCSPVVGGVEVECRVRLWHTNLISASHLFVNRRDVAALSSLTSGLMPATYLLMISAPWESLLRRLRKQTPAKSLPRGGTED